MPEDIILHNHRCDNLKYCNVDGQSVAKQLLCKQTSTIERLFYWVRAATVAMQWFGKHVSTVEAVFHGVRAEELS
jgi:hypothetical protein